MNPETRASLENISRYAEEAWERIVRLVSRRGSNSDPRLANPEVFLKSAPPEETSVPEPSILDVPEVTLEPQSMFTEREVFHEGESAKGPEVSSVDQQAEVGYQTEEPKPKRAKTKTKTSIPRGKSSKRVTPKVVEDEALSVGGSEDGLDFQEEPSAQDLEGIQDDVPLSDIEDLIDSSGRIVRIKGRDLGRSFSPENYTFDYNDHLRLNFGVSKNPLTRWIAERQYRESLERQRGFSEQSGRINPNFVGTLRYIIDSAANGGLKKLGTNIVDLVDSTLPGEIKARHLIPGARAENLRREVLEMTLVQLRVARGLAEAPSARTKPLLDSLARLKSQDPELYDNLENLIRKQFPV